MQHDTAPIRRNRHGARDVDGVHVAEAAHRRYQRKAGSGNAGQHADGVDEPLVEAKTVGGRDMRRLDVDHDDAAAVEAERNAREPLVCPTKSAAATARISASAICATTRPDPRPMCP